MCDRDERGRTGFVRENVCYRDEREREDWICVRECVLQR